MPCIHNEKEACIVLLLSVRKKQNNGKIMEARMMSKYLPPFIYKANKIRLRNSKFLAVTLKSNVKVWIEKNKEKLSVSSRNFLINV